MKSRLLFVPQVILILLVLSLTGCGQDTSPTTVTSQTAPTASPTSPLPTATSQPTQPPPQATNTPTQEPKPSQGDIPPNDSSSAPTMYRGSLTTTIVLDVNGQRYQHKSQHTVQVLKQPGLRAEAGLNEGNPFNLKVTPDQLTAPGALLLSTAEYSSSPDQLKICKEGIGSCLYVVKMWSLTGSAQHFSGTMTGAGLVDVAGVSVNTGNTLVALECGGPLSPAPPATPTCSPCAAYLVPGTTMSGTITDTALTIHIQGSAQGLTCGGMGASAIPFAADIEAAHA